MKRPIARLIVLPIFLLGMGGGDGLDSEERGASLDESWKCDGPRADLALAARARAAGDRMRIDLEFENRTDLPVSGMSLGAGERYEWGNDPNEPPPVKTSVLAPEGWMGNLGYQFEGRMMTIFWRARERENRVPPGGRLEGLSFETQDERLPPGDPPFNVIAVGKGCMWGRWTVELAPVESEE